MNLELIGYIMTTTGYLLVPATFLFHGHPKRRRAKPRKHDEHFLEKGMISYTWMSLILVALGSVIHFMSQGWI